MAESQSAILSQGAICEVSCCRWNGVGCRWHDMLVASQRIIIIIIIIILIIILILILIPILIIILILNLVILIIILIILIFRLGFLLDVFYFFGFFSCVLLLSFPVSFVMSSLSRVSFHRALVIFSIV